MIPLPTLLRDAAVAMVVFAAVGGLLGSVSVTAGALLGLLNVTGMVWVASGDPQTLFGRLAAQNVAAVGSLLVVLSIFEAGAVVAGLCGPVFGAALRYIPRTLGVRA